MGQIVGGAAKPKRCNLNKLSQLGTPVAGEHILVSSDNSMNEAGQGYFDCYIVGDGSTAASALSLRKMKAEELAEDLKALECNFELAVEVTAGTDNVYNPANEQQGIIIASGGSETPNASYTTNTEYIPAKTGQYISCFGADSSNKNGVAFAVFYDANKNFIQRKSTQYGSVYNFSIDPVGVEFVRFCTWINSTNIAIYINNENPNYTDENFPYKPYQEASAIVKYTALPKAVQDAVVETNNITENLNFGYRYTELANVAEYFTSAYISSSGSMVNSSSWWLYRLQVNEIPDFSEIVVESFTNVTGRYQVAFYSSSAPSDQTFISGFQFNAPSAKNTVVITEIPTNAVSLLIANLEASGNITVTVKSAKEKSNVDELDEAVERLSTFEISELRARFDNQFNYIAYSAMMVSGAGPNSESQYLWGARRKFVSIKGDVRISSDGEIVMCHDEGFTLNQDGEVIDYDANNMTPIRNMTASQCYALKYAGTSDYVCGLDALVRTCKLYGKIAFITVRSSYLDEIFPKIFECLDRYSMRERSIINGFSYTTMKKARKYDSRITLSWVQNHNSQITNSIVDQADGLGNCLITCYDYSGSQTTAINQNDSVLAYAQEKNVRVYEAIIGYDSDLNNAVLYDRGFTGAQVAFEPEIFSQSQSN